jgi:hypothetical protein
MIKKLLNYIRREDEIKRLKRDVQCLHILLNRLDETTRFELSRINHTMIAVQAREEILVDEVIRLQERNIYEQ